MSETMVDAPLPDCSIALKWAAQQPPAEGDPTLERCLDSIDDDVSVNIVITPCDAVEGMLRERGIPYSTTRYGSIARSCDIGVQEAKHDNVIIMDSDCWFVPGAIRKLRETLRDNVLAKGSVRFLGDTAMSRLIARRRLPFNSMPDMVSCPSLALRRSEVEAACGGYVFNPKVRWTEDADLNYRVQRAGLKIAYVPEAEVWHDPIDLGHELRAAFLYGVGKRLSIENTPGRVPYEELPDVVRAVLRGMVPQNLLYNIRQQGADVFLLENIWQAVYLAGYHTQKLSGKWTETE